MTKQKPGGEERSNENPAPTSPDYETFLVTASKEGSKKVVTLLSEAGVRVNETVWHEIGLPEYVIEVHREDLVRARELYWKDVGPCRTFTSNTRGE
jgi:hypothetical protein